MKILIDLDDTTLTKIKALAVQESRKRKQMIELIIKRSVQN